MVNSKQATADNDILCVYDGLIQSLRYDVVNGLKTNQQQSLLFILYGVKAYSVYYV